MSTGKKTGSSPGAVLAAVAVVIAVIAVASHGLPSRQPPDPFEDEPIREVRLMVEWGPNPEFDPPRERTARVTYAVGDDAADLRLFMSESPWEHTTTAQASTFVELAASPDDYGDITCTVEIDGEVPPNGTDTTDDVEGCLVEVLA